MALRKTQLQQPHHKYQDRTSSTEVRAHGKNRRCTLARGKPGRAHAGVLWGPAFTEPRPFPVLTRTLRGPQARVTSRRRAWPRRRRRGRTRGAAPEEEVVWLLLSGSPPPARWARCGAVVSAAASRSPFLPSMFPGVSTSLPQAAVYSGVYGSNGRTPQPGEWPAEYCVFPGAFPSRVGSLSACPPTFEVGRRPWQGWAQRPRGAGRP